MRAPLVWIAACLLCVSCKTDPKEAEASCTSSNFQGQEAARTGDYKSAETFYRQAIELAGKGADPTQLPKSLIGLGDVLLTEKKFDESEANFRKALNICTELANSQKDAASSTTTELNLERINCLVKLADIKVLQEQPNDAVKFYRDALALSRTSGGAVEESSRISRKLAQVLHSLHQEDEADDLDAEALAETLTAVESKSLYYKLSGIEEKNAPVDKDPHGKVRQIKALIIVAKRMQKAEALRLAYQLLGRTEMKRGRYKQAEFAFKQTVEGLKPGVDEAGVFGSVQCDTAAELTELACLAELQGKQQEADKLFKQAFEADFATAIFTLSNEAETYPHQAFITRLSQAIENANARETKSIYQNEVADVIGRAGMRALNVEHNNLAAEKFCKLAIPIYERTIQYNKSNKIAFESATIELSDTIFNLGHAYVLENKPAEADRCFDRSLALLNSLPGNHNLQLGMAFLGKAHVCRMKSNFAEAEQLARKSTSLFEKAGGPNSPQRKLALSELEAAQAKQTK